MPVDKNKLLNMKTPLEKMAEEGVLPEELADAIAAIPAVKAKRIAVIEREERKAKAYRESTLTIKQQIAAKNAAKKAEEERIEREVKSRLDAKEEEIEREAKALADRIEQKKIKDAEREVERKAEAKIFDARLAAKKVEIARADEAKRKEASRASKVKAIITRVDIILSNEDALYGDLKSLTRLQPSHAEQKQLKAALRDASVRFAEQSAKL